MGLDMYLHKHTYIGNQYKEPAKLVKVNVKGVKNKRVTEVVEVVGTWRKANAIHKWFVDHVQDGHDDCGDYWVYTEKLKKLLSTVNKVLAASELIEGEIQNGTHWTKEDGEQPIMEKGKYIKDPTVAQELLPTAEGFFFGSMAYDQYYYADLEETKKILEQAIKEGGDYYYHSSW